jgi:cytochrome c-type biogenesis protein
MNRIKKHMRTIERAMGFLLLIVGAALLTGAFTALSWWLLEQFPALGALG